MVLFRHESEKLEPLRRLSSQTGLKEAIEQMNSIFDDPDLSSGDSKGIVAYVSAKASKDLTPEQWQAKANSMEQFLDSPGQVPAMLTALLAAKGSFSMMTKELAEDDTKRWKFIKAISKVIHAQLAEISK